MGAAVDRLRSRRRDLKYRIPSVRSRRGRTLTLVNPSAALGRSSTHPWIGFTRRGLIRSEGVLHGLFEVHRSTRSPRLLESLFT